MTTVVCVWVRGHVPFTSEYVTKLSAMVRRWMDRPYRFVCLSDQPKTLEKLGIEAIHVEPPVDCYAWWTKVRLFDRSHGFTGRMLYLDLDTLVVNALAPIIDYPARFALIPHSGRFNGMHGRSVVKRFNSSVMVWNASEQDYLFDRWTPLEASRLHGDQDWIGEQATKAEAMPIEWYPRISEVRGGPVPRAAKVILMKTPKNRIAARRYPWVKAAWA